LQTEFLIVIPDFHLDQPSLGVADGVAERPGRAIL
jgi:hypothetical protein